MLKILSDAQTVARCERLFIRRFRPFWDRKVPVKIGHQGASFAAQAAWSERLGIWMAVREEQGRYGHIFGTTRPSPGGSVSIACEINFPQNGVDRRIGAAFARDDSGRIYVIHRGKIGGGQKGIGKNLFEKRYRGVWADLDEDGPLIMVAVVGEVGSPRFPRQVAQFVRKVTIIKDAVSTSASAQTAMPLDDRRFLEELTGERYEDMRPDLSRACDHALIVRDLAAALKGLGYRTGNDSHEDLFALNGGNRAATVFHINADTRRRKIHEGITRLFFSSLSRRGPCRLVLVVPEPPEALLRTRLQGLNIETLTYDWQDEVAVFAGLEALMYPAKGKRE